MDLPATAARAADEFFGGRERSKAELTELAAAHHLTLSSVTAVAADRTLLEFTPAAQC